MTFPLGGDFPKNVQGLFKILKSDRRICVHDNGTDVCDRGHKLKFPGTCLNQAIGTFNSTDPTFQPTFPVCTDDYQSSGFNNGILFSTPAAENDYIVASLQAEVTKEHPFFEISKAVSGVYNIFRRASGVSSDHFISSVANTISSVYFPQVVSNEVSSFWKMVQLNPGFLPRGMGVYSDLYTLDVASKFTVYNRLVFHMLEYLVGNLKQEGDKSMYKNLVTYTTVSGTGDVCIGDQTPPFITYHSPTQSGTVLRPIDQNVDFSLGDAVAGVDLTTVTITLSGTSAGNVPLLIEGVNQEPGDFSVIGDQSSYRFTYTPPINWQFNERVLVTITGSDLPPMVDGNPFFCGAAEVNTFIGDLHFKVLNQEDFPATITAIPDTSPPYLSYTLPASGTTDNNVFTPVQINIADDFTGVDLSTLNITVDEEQVINNGVPATSETTISGSASEYFVTYTPNSAFTYGNTVSVFVSAFDRRESSPNELDTSYSFSFIEDGTLVIENFLPAVGTTRNLDSVDIQVDIRDDTYGVDTDQSFLTINGTIVSGTHTPITSGTRITYHPPNDFDYGGPINVLVHGTNANISSPVVKEQLFRLFYGCSYVYDNVEGFSHADQVDVFVKARNTEQLHKDLTTGYFFSTYTQPQENLSASIIAINPTSDLPATIIPVAPEHRYGETVTVEIYLEDFDGHVLGPYTFSYTIENRPE